MKTRTALILALALAPAAALADADFTRLDANRGGVRLPLLAVAPVLLGDLVLLVLDARTLLEAPQLLLRADVQPELGQAHAVAGQLPLELVDLGIGAAPFMRLGKTLDALDQHAAVPGAVVDRDVAAARNVAPEAPQVMVRALLVGGRRHRNHAEQPRIDRGDDAADRAALAGGVPAFEHRDRRDLLFLG